MRLYEVTPKHFDMPYDTVHGVLVVAVNTHQAFELTKEYVKGRDNARDFQTYEQVNIEEKSINKVGVLSEIY